MYYPDVENNTFVIIMIISSQQKSLIYVFQRNRKRNQLDTLYHLIFVLNEEIEVVKSIRGVVACKYKPKIAKNHLVIRMKSAQRIAIYQDYCFFQPVSCTSIPCIKRQNLNPEGKYHLKY